ncbi:hypothetical protein GALMADRAFT_1335736 [Galerina marginata CBS 339.88]|uniref:Aspartic peptidase DDI1-type domain-containing protein n=1 Tax=Galerina marginata (strain CBS 339.88) TaxID=685588 RepID=A0A067SSM5_GALM3|nr:hypothetical protein GALMADRAFT_1335736 [Galerina marginata CBS 339.88]
MSNPAVPINSTSNDEQPAPVPQPNPVPAQTATFSNVTSSNIKPYPARGSKDAPHFGGPQSSLERYLEDIEELCIYRGEDNDLAKYKKALWYVDIKYVDSWKRILDAAKTWTVNKAALLAFYPGLDSLYKYSVNDMKKLVDSSAAKEVSKPDHLAQYHCEFMIIASYLEKERLMTKDNINRHYILGLPPNFRATEITDQLTTSLFQFQQRIMIKEGKCKQGPDGRIVMPDRSFIRGYGPLKDRIEAATQDRSREIPPHMASTMMFKSTETVESMFTASKIEEIEDEDDPTATAYKLSTRANKVVEEKAATPPQYKFASDIEDPELVKQVIKKSLEGTITLSQKELLAVSSDIRRYYKDKTTAKRLPTTVGMLEVLGDEKSENRTYVLRFVQGDRIQRKVLTASPINRLRVIFAVLNNSVKAECVLDQGSEIMAMDKKVWEKTQHELKPNKTISMESANSQSSLTARLCENLKMKFGNLELYLQVHVVENAPFEVLVGRPFFIYTECVTRDYADGNQDITLTCPNTHTISTFPTLPREKLIEVKEPELDFIQSREL